MKSAKLKSDMEYYIATDKNYKTISDKVNETCAMIERLLAHDGDKTDDNDRKKAI